MFLEPFWRGTSWCPWSVTTNVELLKKLGYATKSSAGSLFSSSLSFVWTKMSILKRHLFQKKLLSLRGSLTMFWKTSICSIQANNSHRLTILSRSHGSTPSSYHQPKKKNRRVKKVRKRKRMRKKRKKLSRSKSVPRSSMPKWKSCWKNTRR